MLIVRLEITGAFVPVGLATQEIHILKAVDQVRSLKPQEKEDPLKIHLFLLSTRPNSC